MKKPDIYVLAVVLFIVYVALYVYCAITYGGKPVAEIPVWAWLILKGKG